MQRLPPIRQHRKSRVGGCLCGCGQVHLFTFDKADDDAPSGVVAMTADEALRMAEQLRGIAHQMLNADASAVRPSVETLQ